MMTLTRHMFTHGEGAVLMLPVFWGSLLFGLLLWGPGRWSVDAWWRDRRAQSLPL